MLDEKEIQELIDLARDAQRNSYAPYSNYHVGAALLTIDRDGNERTFQGCNVENAAYGSTICAERGAIMNAVVSTCRNFKAIAIIGEGNHWAAPCGSCRQFLVEFNPELEVIMVNAETGDYKVLPLSELLPMKFTEKELRNKQ